MLEPNAVGFLSVLRFFFFLNSYDKDSREIRILSKAEGFRKT